MILAQPVIELGMHRLYEKKEDSLTSKLMRKGSLLSGVFWKEKKNFLEKKKILLTL
jgi:hypothetical protein